MDTLHRVLVRQQCLLVPEAAALFRSLRQAPLWNPEADLDVLRQVEPPLRCPIG
jgi:hypothetical protein